MRARLLRTLLPCLLIVPVAYADFLFPPEPATVQCPEGDVVLLAYGEHTNCSIDPVTDGDIFRFEGSADETVRIIVHSMTAMDPRIQVFEPGNPAPIAQRSCFGACTIVSELSLTLSGTYEISLSERESDLTGPYTMQLQRIPPTSSALSLKIPYEFPITLPINPPTDQDFVTFDGAEGTLVKIIARSNTAMDPCLDVWDPTGAQIKHVSCIGACTLEEDILLDQTGTYLIGVSEREANQTGSVELSVQCPLANCPNDIDQDTISDAADDCFRQSNPSQCDADGDGIGNICDPDFNNNCSVDAADFAKLKNDLLTNDPDSDLNCNGIVDAADFSILKNQLLEPPGPSGLAPCIPAP